MTRATTLSLLAVAAVACGGDETSTDASVPPPEGAVSNCLDGTQRSCVIVGESITANTTWTADKVYVIPRFQHTFVKMGATLTIMPGTEIQGDKGAVLTISRGAKIMAEGTVQQPILFTSAQPGGQKTPGFWGGLLVLGYAAHNTNAATNSGEALFEAFSNAEGESGRFGKNPIGSEIANDNSGVIKYVRIEFGGYNFVQDREFNNLTLCGVGNGTTIDYVQVHAGSDDGIEFFGGTVNVKHIVSSQNEDDGFDTDNGWVGKAQYVIVQNVAHRPGITEASNGYESDNHGTAASFRASPRTLPTIANATLIGDHSYADVASWAAVFRRGTGGHYLNHVWYNFPRGPEIRDPETAEQVAAGNLTVGYSVLYKNDTTATNLPVPQASNDIDEGLVFNLAVHDVLGTTDPGMAAAATSRTAPDFKPPAGAWALNAVNAAPADEPLLADPFFDKTSFVGAIGTTDWTAGWTKYPQN